MVRIKITMLISAILGALLIVWAAFDFVAFPGHGSYKMLFSTGMLLFVVCLLGYFVYAKSRKIRKTQG